MEIKQKSTLDLLTELVELAEVTDRQLSNELEEHYRVMHEIQNEILRRTGDQI